MYLRSLPTNDATAAGAAHIDPARLQLHHRTRGATGNEGWKKVDLRSALRSAMVVLATTDDVARAVDLLDEQELGHLMGQRHPRQAQR